MSEISKESQARQILENLVFIKKKLGKKGKLTRTVHSHISLDNPSYRYQKSDKRTGPGYTEPIESVSSLETLGALTVKYKFYMEDDEGEDALIFLESPTLLRIELDGKVIKLKDLFSRWVRDVDNGKGKEELERIGAEAVDLIRNELPNIGLPDFLKTGETTADESEITDQQVTEADSPEQPEQEEDLEETKNPKEPDKVLTYRFERKQELRDKAIDVYGTSCIVCGFNFEKVYGSLGADFIEVHHLIPISNANGNEIGYQNLRPVCPNCHRMFHRLYLDKVDSIGVQAIEELKKIMQNQREKNRV